MVTVVKHDLEFILKQIKIAEAHAAGGDLAQLVAEAGALDAPTAANGVSLQAHLLPYGLRTVDGTYNNLIDGRENWAAADQPFVPLVDPEFVNEGDDSMMFGTPANPVWLTNNDYGSSGGAPLPGQMLPAGTVVDADPRLISNLVVDQTSKNPAATMLYDAMLAEGKNATRTEMRDAGGNIVTHVADVLGFNGNVIAAAGTPVWIYTFENISPDIGDSAPYNSMFTLFGQFFDHGLDLVAKGGNGTVYIPLQPDDPLYNPATPHTNFMVMTRVTEGAPNVTTPWVDQNQTYTSHASHQVFLREYRMHEDKPVATGHLLEGERGLATWADVKEQARTMLGIELTDADVTNVPLLRTDPYGNFIPDANGYAQIVVGIGPDGTPNTSDDIVISGTPDSPASTATAVRIGHAFLDDIAHAAAPVLVGGVLQADGDNATGYANANGTPGPVNSRGSQTAYDNELLDAHYITGDGRGNENVGLTSIHHVFHSEHNGVVDQTKNVVLASNDLAFINQWLREPVATVPASQAELDALVWNGERLFQAGRFTTEMQYQHLVFEEFGRKMQPDIDAFVFEPSADVNPAIFAEFAHAVYRFGHSMLNQDIGRLIKQSDGSYAFDNITLFDGFLNPLALGAVDSAGNVIIDHDEAAGAVIRGMSRQGGNEIDEFVTDVLRNQLVGIPLDLAALNIARGRDVGLPSLNEARAQFHQMAGQDSQLTPYISWTDFALNMQNPASIVNFIAAYGTHGTVTSATTIDGKRAAAAALVLGGTAAPADRLDFLNSTGAWASQESGLNDIDLWIGGLAEKKMDFGGMLGSTFSFVFELQMENLQEGDRFYYLSRVQGLNLLNELENNSLTEIIMRNTDLGDGSTALPGNIFSTPDLTLELDQSKQVDDDPTFANPILQALTPLVLRKDTDGDGEDDYLAYNGGAHVVIGGTEGNDTLIAGEGDDTVWGYGGDDRIEGGYGVDFVHGGEGDDIITNAGTDIGAADFLHGEGGNDVIHGGSGLALIFGNSGNDFIIGGPDGKHVMGGLGNDFIRGGDGGDVLAGNEGDDWIEGGGRFDTLTGENSELMFNSTIIGHDVLNAQGSDGDYDAESGDDIMFQNEGIQRSNGMAGFDWAVHKGDTQAANSDLGIPLFATQEAFILRDRFDLVEGLSGWKHNDILTGRAAPTNARAELQNTAAIPGPDSPIDSFSNALLQKNVALVNGLDQLVAHKTRIAVTDTNGNPVLDANGKPEMIVFDTADASDILLGGGGSDQIKGLAGNDIIDGDRWLNVRIAIKDASGVEIGSADGMTTQIFSATGALLYGGRTLDALMFDRTLNPGQLAIVREIVDGDPANSATDVAIYTDVVANYTFTANADGSITVDHSGFDEDAADGDEEAGARPLSDGSDRLWNIERLRFADGEFAVNQLVNAPATGAPVINDLTPTEGQTLTVNTAAIQDTNGLGAFSYQWQVSENGGTTWANLLGATGSSFTPNEGLLGLGSQIGDILRVRVSFTDGAGHVEELFSSPTGVVGDNWDAIPLLANTFNGTAGDDIADGTSGLFGLGANDTLNGNGGNDILSGNGGTDLLNGGAGDDILNGGAGGDTAIYAGGVGNFALGSSGNNIMVTDTTGAEGTDTVTAVETLRFNGANYSVVTGGTGNNANLNGAAGANGSQAVFGLAGADSLFGGAGADLLVGGAGDDVVNGGTGADTLYWSVGDGRDLLDGGGDVDVVKLTGDATAETFRIYSRTEALAAGMAVAAATEIVITRNGTNNASIIAELDNIEEIIINGRGGGDTFIPIGTFAGTSLLTSTITLEGTTGDDTVDIRALESAHRVVFRSNGGNDLIVGTLRAQDVIELPEGAVPGDYAATIGNNGLTTLSSTTHSVSFTGVVPQLVIAGSIISDSDVTDGIDWDGADGISNVFEGSTRNDSADGGNLTDTMNGNGGDDWLRGGLGDDILNGGAGNDRLNGQDGNDTLNGGDGDDQFNGEAGNDTINGGDGNDSMNGADGDDVLNGDAGNDYLLGGAGDDVLNGGSGHDRLNGQAGDDIISGGAGDDLFNGEAGNDTIHGGDGNDSMNGADGDDVLNGDAGIDLLTGGVGNDRLNGGADNDKLEGGIGNDLLNGDDGDDYLLGGTGNDLLNGGSGNDRLNGQAGDDRINGGAGEDMFNGEAGNDILNGGEGNDRIDGGVDDDTIVQYAATGGRDLVNGNLGIDTYTLIASDESDTFRFYTRSEAVKAGMTGIGASTEIIVTHNGTGNASIIAELDNIEKIEVENRFMSSNGQGDTVEMIGDFSRTSVQDDYFL